MAFLRNKKITLSPSEEYDFPITGDSIRLVSANVPIYFKTRDGSLDFYLEKGEKAQFDENAFQTLTIYHLDAADQSIIISVGKGADVGSAKFSGEVVITGGSNISLLRGPAGYLFTYPKTVTNVSSQIDGINVNRKYYAIQNKSLTGKIWINTGGAAATQANGILLNPQEVWAPDYVQLGVVTAIGDIASNPDILVVQAT